MPSGCVRRTARFTTEPAGARLYLNDEDVGRTPVTVAFTWYGDYDVRYRLKGYQTLHTHVRLNPPVYQIFPLDFFTEVMWPGELHDHHDVPTQTLLQAEPIDSATLQQRALEFRDRTLFESEPNAQAPGN